MLALSKQTKPNHNTHPERNEQKQKNKLRTNARTHTDANMSKGNETHQTPVTYSQVPGVVDVDVDDGGVGLVGAHDAEGLHSVPVLVAALPKCFCGVVCSHTAMQQKG